MNPFVVSCTSSLTVGQQGLPHWPLPSSVNVATLRKHPKKAQGIGVLSALWMTELKVPLPSVPLSGAQGQGVSFSLPQSSSL